MQIVQNKWANLAIHAALMIATVVVAISLVSFKKVDEAGTLKASLDLKKK